MILLLQAVLGGVLLGGVYALAGVGLHLAFGAARFVNLAHGELVMLGMYGTWLLSAHLGWDPYLSLLVVVPVLFLSGALLQSTVMGRALRAPPERQLLLGLGLGLLLSSGVALAFGPERRVLALSSSRSRLEVLGLSLSQPLLVSFAITVGLIGALLLFLHRTDAGRAVRAAAEDRETALLMGIDVRRVSALAFGLGAALAGALGALVAPTAAISPQAGGPFTPRAVVIAMLAGRGRVAGAILGGLLVGLAESLATAYVAPGIEELVVLGLLLVLLIANPSGSLVRARA